MFIQQDFFNIFFGWTSDKGQEPAPMPFFKLVTLFEPVAFFKPATPPELAMPPKPVLLDPALLS
jgi:hypothetical protein